MAIATPWPPPNLGVVWLAIYGLTMQYVLYEATKFSHEKKARGPLLSIESLGWFIGILISWFMKYSLYNWVGFHPLPLPGTLFS